MYDHLSKRNTLPKARKVKFDGHAPFKSSITKGFEYHDCWVDDSRLVVINAIDAHLKGANIEVQSQCTNLMFDNEHRKWRLSIFNKVEQRHYDILANNVVNASGPWLNSFLDKAAKEIKPARNIRLIKGSHIIVPRSKELDQAYILQNEDKRVVFVLPYLDHFSIIGTTDKEYQGKPENVEIEDWEVEYLIKVYNQHFKHPIAREDIRSSYSGVRPLCDDESNDPSAITRDYTLELHEQTENNALLSIYGGKITTYRKLSEAALSKLDPYIKEQGQAWTANHPMPGVQFTGQSREQLRKAITDKAPWLSTPLVDRYLKAYGTLCFTFLANKQGMSDMGEYFGSSLFSAEVDYLIEHEWAKSAEDILWRRSKLGLFLTSDETERLKQYVKLRLSTDNHAQSNTAAA
jgi:glycerol-3-phosphate dehydrogenase